MDFYHPVIARPFERDIYREIAPHTALRPYIRCFWEMGCGRMAPWLVVPDTCADLIFQFSADGRVQYSFCGIGDEPFWSMPPEAELYTFGVRFYGWGVGLFADESLRGTANSLLEPEAYFRWITPELVQELAACGTMAERTAKMEKALLKEMEAIHPNGNFFQAVYRILLSGGNVSLRDLSFETALSTRQLERIFAQNLGLSPKKLADLVRYQMLWQQMLRPDYDAMDAVERFGFYDQAHLLHTFKRYHSLSPAEALHLAGK